MNKNIYVKIFIASNLLIALNGCKLARKPGDVNQDTGIGWIPLFDGTTLKGWHTYGKDSAGSAWKAEDSTIHLNASIKDGWQTQNGGDIVTYRQFKNFDLELDWKISDAGNSGIMIYVNEDTSKYKYAWNSGPEVQICDNDKNEDGKVYKSQAGDIYELFHTSSDKYVKPAMQWNHTEIISNDGRLQLFMNDQQVLDTTIWDDAWKQNIAGTKFKDMPGFGTYKRGRIALQDHGADVWFKNIKIKNL